MFGLDKFLELFKDTKVVIPTLIAIIIVGGIGGGLWIKNLNDIISTHKELSDEKIALISEKNNNLISRLEQRYNDFEYDYNRTKREIDRTRDSIGKSITNLEAIAIKTNDTIVRANIVLELNRIKNQYENYSHRISDLDSEFNRTSASIHDLTRVSNNIEHAISPIFLFISLSIAALITLIFFISKRRKSKKKT